MSSRASRPRVNIFILPPKTRFSFLFFLEGFEGGSDMVVFRSGWPCSSPRWTPPPLFSPRFKRRFSRPSSAACHCVTRNHRSSVKAILRSYVSRQERCFFIRSSILSRVSSFFFFVYFVEIFVHGSCLCSPIWN